METVIQGFGYLALLIVLVYAMVATTVSLSVIANPYGYSGTAFEAFIAPYTSLLRPVLRKPKPDAWRFFHWLYASAHGYYWLPCPLCGKNTGGHEDGGSIPGGLGFGRHVCVKCNAKPTAEEKKKMLDDWHKMCSEATSER